MLKIFIYSLNINVKTMLQNTAAETQVYVHHQLFIFHKVKKLTLVLAGNVRKVALY